MQQKIILSPYKKITCLNNIYSRFKNRKKIVYCGFFLIIIVRQKKVNAINLKKLIPFWPASINAGGMT